MTTDKPSERALDVAKPLAYQSFGMMDGHAVDHLAKSIALALERFAAESREAENRACEALADEPECQFVREAIAARRGGGKGR